MSNFFLGILQIINEFKNYIYVLVAVALLCLAIAGLVGTDRVKSTIKENLLWIAFFAGLGLGCVSFASWITSKFSF